MNINILKELPKLTKGNASKTLSIIFEKEHIYKNIFEKCKEIIIKHRELGAKEYLYFDVSYNEGEKDLLLLVENDGNGLCGEFIVNNTNKNDYDYVLTLLNILNQTLIDLIGNIRNEEGQMKKHLTFYFFLATTETIITCLSIQNIQSEFIPPVCDGSYSFLL